MRLSTNPWQKVILSVVTVVLPCVAIVHSREKEVTSDSPLRSERHKEGLEPVHFDTEIANISSWSRCQKELNGLLFNTRENQIQALDAFGRPAAGLLAGNKAWYGHFTECQNLIDFRYCLLDLEIENATFPTIERQNIGIRWGVCAPTNCTSGDLNENIDMLLDFLRVTYDTDLKNVISSGSCASDPPVPYSTGYYVTLSVAAVICTLMILGSIVDVIERSRDRGADMVGNAPRLRVAKEEESIPLMDVLQDQNTEPEDGKTVFQQILSALKEVLLAFAFNRNLSKLMDVREGVGTVGCLHGIRVLSMVWIIAAHIFYSFVPLDYVNPNDVARSQNGLFFEIVFKNTSSAVDSFIFLSGLLVCYTTLLKLDKQNGRFNWFWFLLHRYIRLTPLLCAVLVTHMYIEPYVYWGPEQTHFAERGLCENNWWKNLLYIQNYWGLYDMCYSVSWYLAVDMQLFVISPIIIYPLYRREGVGFGLMSLLMSISFAITGVIVVLHDLPASITATIGSEIGRFMYIQTYLRVPPYLVGMFLGFILHKTRDAEKPVISKPAFLLGWIVAAIIASAVLLIPFRHNDPTVADPSLGRVVDTAFQVFNRFFWGIFLLWVVISCQFGGPGWVNDILSWKAWVPLSRCTYAVYLLHIMLFLISQVNQIQPLYFSLVLKTTVFFGIMTAAYIGAVILHTSIEMPVARLEQLYLPKP